MGWSAEARNASIEARRRKAQEKRKETPAVEVPAPEVVSTPLVVETPAPLILASDIDALLGLT